MFACANAAWTSNVRTTGTARPRCNQGAFQEHSAGRGYTRGNCLSPRYAPFGRPISSDATAASREILERKPGYRRPEIVDNTFLRVRRAQSREGERAGGQARVRLATEQKRGGSVSRSRRRALVVDRSPENRLPRLGEVQGVRVSRAGLCLT